MTEEESEAAIAAVMDMLVAVMAKRPADGSIQLPLQDFPPDRPGPSPPSGSSSR